jgi:hypothetical protein
MMIRLTVALALLISPGMPVAQKVPAVEDTIAGITVGKSTLMDVQRRFGGRLTVDQSEGRHAVKLDGQCELFFDFEPGDSNQPNSLVMNIQLSNLGSGAQRGSPCDRFGTGRGLKLSDSPDMVQRLYGSPNSKFMRKQLSVDRFENSALCADPSKHMINSRNMFIEWLPNSNVIQNISVSIEHSDCDEWRKGDAGTP